MASRSMIRAALIMTLIILWRKIEAVNIVATIGGPKGGGDATQAITSAWQRACTSPGPSTLTIPKGTFMVGNLVLGGPCKAPISVQVQGTLRAPPDMKQLKDKGSWITFQDIDGLTLSGGGTFDGQGSLAWSQNNCGETQKCHLPVNLVFNSVNNSKIQGITSLNSKMFHLNIDGCSNVTLEKITVNAPRSSINTDGIHIGRSTGITITSADIKTGDDCVSLGDGSQQITVQGVTCGPGHGIGIGSLGKYENEKPVTGVFVRNCTLTNTMFGLRVKTWPSSPSGIASDLHFEDITMTNVSSPILIDQNYCPYGQCSKEAPSRVKISNVSFKNIKGTSATPVAVSLVCSRGVPCQQVAIGDINLRYNGRNGTAISECANVKPRIMAGNLYPPVCARTRP